MPLNVNLLDTLNFDSDAAEHLLDEVYDDCPTLSGYDKTNNRSIPIVVDETDQDAIKTLVRTKLPEVSPFRYANEGVKPSKGTYEPRMISLATVTSFWDCDQSIIRKNPRRGARFMEAEAIGTMRAHTLAMEQQFFYGNKKDGGAFEKGFQGLTDFCDPLMVTDAKGADADNLASIWFVWWDMLGVSWVYGQEGHVGLSEPELTTVTDEKGGKFKAYEQTMEFYPGLNRRTNGGNGSCRL